MLATLWLPILMTAVALFFMSFLSWMVLGLHKDDWKKLDGEDALLASLRNLSVPEGNYMFPGSRDQAEMKSEEFKSKMEAGPRGIISVYSKVNMPRNLILTFLSFLIVTSIIAYVGGHSIAASADFIHVFRFFFVVALLAYLTGTVQNAIWFPARVVGHVIESVAYAAVTGVIFGALWT